MHETTYSDSFAQEFKSPLDTMLGMLDLLLTTTMSIKQREYRSSLFIGADTDESS